MIALGAATVAGLVLGWYGFTTAFGDGSQAVVPIQTVTLQPTTLRQTATTSGNIVATQNSKLTFPTAGRLAGLNVKAGQSVNKGDVIATLDATQLKIALDQAKSQTNTAQAKLDALLAGATPDVVEAARAAVEQGKSSQAAAQGQVANAETGKVTNNNAVGTAQNQVQTAANAAVTAHDQVINAQNGLQTAINNYQALVNGPTPQDVAVTQSAVDSARVSLDTAQANYDRLVNHTDIATRPETSALISAGSAYQTALAALANAQPQPANPLDVANQQLAVQTAQAQVQSAQQDAAAAQAAAVTAQQNLVNTPPALNTPSGTCTIYTNGQCVIDNGSIPPTTAALNAVSSAQNAVTNAQTQANSAASLVITGQLAYQKALNDLQKLLNPFSTQDLSGIQAQADASRQQLDIARRNFDSYINLPDLAIRPETTALNTARSAYNSAVAQYNLKVAPPKDTDVGNAQTQISNAQAAVDSAGAAESSANVAISSAGLGVSNAAATASNSDTAINSATAGVQSAAEAVTSAQTKLDQVTAPPLPTDVTQAVEAVNQAKLSVQNAQTNVDNATLTAPYSGVITSVTGNPGDQVTSATIMAGLVDPARVELDAQVDETTYGQVKVGMPVQVRLDALPGQVLTGVVTTVVPSGVTTQGVVLFPVVIQLNTQGGVPPNQASASQITVIIQAKANVLVAPSGYVYRNVQGQPVVDVIKDGKRTPTVATLGLTDTAGNTEVTSGLKAGDQIAKPSTKKGSSGAAFGQGGVPGLNGAGGGARPAAGGPGGR